MKKLITMLILGILIVFCSAISYAHSGRTDASGGHHNRKTGGYHYHNSGYRRSTPKAHQPSLIPAKDPAVEIAELKVIIKKREKTIHLARLKIVKLKKQLAETKKENRQLRTLCRRAGVRIPRFLEQIPQIDIAETVGPFNKALEVGQIGRLERVRIIQVIDANNSLAEIAIEIPNWSSSVRSTAPPGQSEVFRSAFVSPTGFPIYDPIHKKELVWLEGIDTTATADNAYLKLNKVFVVARTKSYTNTLNAKRTVYVLRPISTFDSYKLK